MELLEDTQYALGLLNAESGGQLNSNNSIAGAKLLYGVKKQIAMKIFCNILKSLTRTENQW